MPVRREAFIARSFSRGILLSLGCVLSIATADPLNITAGTAVSAGAQQDRASIALPSPDSLPTASSVDSQSAKNIEIEKASAKSAGKWITVVSPLTTGQIRFGANQDTVQTVEVLTENSSLELNIPIVKHPVDGSVRQLIKQGATQDESNSLSQESSIQPKVSTVVVSETNSTMKMSALSSDKEQGVSEQAPSAKALIPVQMFERLPSVPASVKHGAMQDEVSASVVAHVTVSKNETVEVSAVQPDLIQQKTALVESAPALPVLTMQETKEAKRSAVHKDVGVHPQLSDREETQISSLGNQHGFAESSIDSKRIALQKMDEQLAAQRLELLDLEAQLQAQREELQRIEDRKLSLRGLNLGLSETEEQKFEAQRQKAEQQVLQLEEQKRKEAARQTEIRQLEEQIAQWELKKLEAQRLESTLTEDNGADEQQSALQRKVLSLYSDELISGIADWAVKLHQLGGMARLETESRACYENSGNRYRCLYFDLAARRIGAVRTGSANSGTNPYFDDANFGYRLTTVFKLDGFDDAAVNSFLRAETARMNVFVVQKINMNGFVN